MKTKKGLTILRGEKHKIIFKNLENENQKKKFLEESKNMLLFCFVTEKMRSGC